MTLPLHLPPVPLATVPMAPVPMAPVPMAPATLALLASETRCLGPALQAPEAPAPAIIEFRGFPPGPLGAPPRDLLLVDAGDPQRAARWFATALASAAEPAQFAVACLRTAPARLGHAPLGPAPLGPLGEERGDGKVAYRYRLALAPAGGAGLRLQCWRYYGEQIGWQRRCGPMALGAFVAHFGVQGAAADLRA
ncbi:MAG: hypothetical protein ACK5RA_09800 [Cyanobacteriota bacterium]